MAARTTAATTSSTKDGITNIRLRRLDSKNSVADSTYSETPTLPPYTSSTSLSKPRDPFLSSTSSTASSVRSSTLISEGPRRSFIPTSALRIESQGKERCSLPLSSNELETVILAAEDEIHTETFSPGDASNVDVGADGIKYISVRPERKSGSCVLVRGDDASQTPLASTTYFFGPGRNPKIWIGAASSPSSPSTPPPPPKYDPNSTAAAVKREDDGDSAGDRFEMVSKKIFSRAVRFETSTWGTFEWRYAGKAERKALSNPPPNNLLLLERVGDAPSAAGGASSLKKGKGRGKEERILVARLVRGEDTRTRGSSSSSAGNGGLLELCLCDEARDQKTPVIDEIAVLVTCMVMLKKEIDRMRAIQVAAVGAVMSG